MAEQTPKVRIKSGRVATKVMTFDGATVNDPGDHDGTGDPATLFTITGTVKMRIFAICETLLAGATATIEVGVAGDTAELIPLTTATDLDTGEIWHDTAPDSGAEALTVSVEKIVTKNVLQEVKTANITSGVLRYICEWTAISEDANVEPA